MKTNKLPLAASVWLLFQLLPAASANEAAEAGKVYVGDFDPPVQQNSQIRSEQKPPPHLSPPPETKADDQGEKEHAKK